MGGWVGERATKPFIQLSLQKQPMQDTVYTYTATYLIIFAPCPYSVHSCSLPVPRRESLVLEIHVGEVIIVVTKS